jgi:hypothetical protein
MRRLRNSLEHPFLPFELSHRLQEIASALEERHASGNALEAARTQRRLTREFEELVETARSYPGCENLLKPLPFEKLRAAAADGPVVILLADKEQAKAIAIPSSTDPVKTIDLSITVDYLDQAGQMLEAETNLSRYSHEYRSPHMSTSDPRSMVKNRPSRRRDPMGQLLSELWRGVVYPIIQALKLKVSHFWFITIVSVEDLHTVQGSQGRDRPRLWWIPTGSFHFLPIHAAQDSSGPGSLSLSDFAVSSYTCGVRNLVDARRQLSQMRLDNGKILLVTQPDVEGFAALPNAIAEANQISRIIPPSAFVQLDDPVAEYTLGIAQTLDACPQASILHLACHGQQNRENSLESGFIFKDGKLTISSLIQLNLSDAFFAFLSACESAKGDVQQPDEIISLSAAMMLAGFKSVIGTMW